MNRKHPEWIPRDDHAWLGWTGLDPGRRRLGGWVGVWVERFLHVQLDRKRETERRQRGRERERGPRALTGVALHSSWGLTADLDLCIFLSMSVSLSRSLPVKTHALTLRVTHTTSQGMLHHVHYSSFNMASLSTRLQHSHNSSHSCLKLKTSTQC